MNVISQFCLPGEEDKCIKGKHKANNGWCCLYHCASDRKLFNESPHLYIIDGFYALPVKKVELRQSVNEDCYNDNCPCMGQVAPVQAGYKSIVEAFDKLYTMNMVFGDDGQDGDPNDDDEEFDEDLDD